MARRSKHPGLQQKFERALADLLADGRSLKARVLIDGVGARASTYNIGADELDDLSQNFANYATRAKDGGVLVSGGPWGGYQLAPTAAPPEAALGSGEPTPSATAATTAAQDATPAEPSAIPRQYWESFLHLPHTVALSALFSSRVISLPNAVDAVRWGNPDMLMLRPSPLARIDEYDSALDPSAFRAVDVSPDCILASIEVKHGLERDRPMFFSAIAEAAANSRWANEAWLVFTDREPSEKPLDEDVISIARTVEVGLLEVRLMRDTQELRTIVHHAAPTRPTLRIGELSRARAGVLMEAQTLLGLWTTDEATFLDVDRAEQKARSLLQHALVNLRRQKGFAARGSLDSLLQPLRRLPEQRTYVNRILKASLRSAAIAAGVDIETDLVAHLAAAAEAALGDQDAEAFRSDLLTFGTTFLRET